MLYTIDKYPNAPILILVNRGSRVTPDMASALASLAAALDDQPEPVFVIMDVRRMAMALDDLSACGQGKLLHHPKLRECMLVTTNGMLKLAAKGLKSAAFGGVSLPVFDTTEHALEYCWQRIAEAA